MVARYGHLHPPPAFTVPFLTTGTSRMAPTAIDAACGGMRTAMKFSTSNIPKFEMEKVAPVYSCGCRRFSRLAQSAIRDSVEMSSSDFAPQSRMTGVIKPSSIP